MDYDECEKTCEQIRAENEKIEPEGYEELCESIKENMEEWQETCGIYNDPSQENPFAYF